MKFFKKKSIKEKILAVMKQLNYTSSGTKHYRLSKKLTNLCLSNPQTIEEITFDETIEVENRRYILFLYSKDRRGSCLISDNPSWARMMREFVIPKVEKLPEEFQAHIYWYQKIHGL